MRRDVGYQIKKKMKSTLYILGITLVITLIVFFVTLSIYNKKLKELSNIQQYDLSKINEGILTKEDIESASSELSKTVEEVSKTIKQEENVEVIEITEENNSEVVPEVNETQTTAVVEEKVEEAVEEKIVEEAIPDPIFVMPVEGTIMRGFAKDNLVYSPTLKEWVTHNGLDIEAEKTTVVKSAANGVVSAIKTDPRYGLTIIVEHVNGYETVYANLLTAEFVSVGEVVTEGQTLGTVGDTASFEIADESHLHFEIIKDGEPIDPSIYVID